MSCSEQAGASDRQGADQAATLEALQTEAEALKHENEDLQARLQAMQRAHTEANHQQQQGPDPLVTDALLADARNQVHSTLCAFTLGCQPNCRCT